MAGPLPKYLIEIRIESTEQLDFERVGRLVEYLGGVATDEGYAFYSSERRSEAMKILTRKYGQRYFVVIDFPQRPTP